MNHEGLKPAHLNRGRGIQVFGSAAKAEAFLRTWQKGILPLQESGFVTNIGVDNLKTWQLERLADAPNCPMPSFHLVKVSP